MVSFGLIYYACRQCKCCDFNSQKGVSILFINGQQAENKISENHINEGFNQVLVRFDKKFGNSGVYSSAPYILSFDVTGDEVKIKSPKARSYIEAEKVFESGNPSWNVMQDEVAIKYQQDIIERKPGFVPFGGLDSRLVEYNESNAIYFKDGVLLDKPAEAVVLAPVTTGMVVEKEAKTQTKTAPTEAQSVEQLKAWYLKASKKERKEFRKWMIDQE